MEEDLPDADVSPLSQEFTEDEITVDVLIYKIEGEDGWTLEVAVDDETSVTWTDLFPTDQAAWDDFAASVAEIGLKGLIDAEMGDGTTIH